MKPKPHNHFEKNSGGQPPDEYVQSTSNHSNFNNRPQKARFQKQEEVFYYKKKEEASESNDLTRISDSNIYKPKSDYRPSNQSQPEHRPLKQSYSEYRPSNQSQPEYRPSNQSQPEYKPSSQSQSEDFYWNNDYQPSDNKTVPKDNKPVPTNAHQEEFYWNEQHRPVQRPSDRNRHGPYNQREDKHSYNKQQKDGPSFNKQQYGADHNKPKTQGYDFQETHFNQKTRHQNKRHVDKPNHKESQNCFPDDCLVCLEKIPTRSKIWVCRQCAVITHLSCLQSWLKNMKTSAKPEDSKATFACPHCNYFYLSEEPEHTCFCGKDKNPQYSQFTLANSCGKLCGRKLNKLCDHFCELVCHSGNCPPCDKTRVFTCYCDKTATEFRCSEILSKNALSCGQKCQKSLNCGTHKCELLCHDGKCSPCQVTEETTCHCEKVTKMSPCSTQFNCENTCLKEINCGKHACQLKCHQGPCQKCTTGVTADETCHCGGDLVVDILGRPRTDCLEPLSSCKQSCNKRLECYHNCVLECHSGDCDCGFTLERKCQCESQFFKIKCSDKNKKLICPNKCAKKLTCGKHNCEVICCAAKPLKKEDSAHICKQTCNSELTCKKHDCHKKCHKGPCASCDAMLSRPLYCACRKEVILPPVLCGTEPPKCQARCNKPLPCNHACYFDCHFGTCPPCEETVAKPCDCGAQLFNNVKCSRTARCQTVCKRQLECGHSCMLMCHSEATCLSERETMRNKSKTAVLVSENGSNEVQFIPKSCTGKCAKNKPNCGHICTSPCHPNTDCPSSSCITMIHIGCECGARKDFVECGGSSQVKHTPLECDPKCKNQKRFKALFEKETENKKLYFSEVLTKFGRDNPKFLKRLEKDLEKMFFNAEDKIVVSFDKNVSDKLQFALSLMATHYYLEVNYLKTDRGYFVDGFKTDKFMIPKIPLSKYIEMINKKELNSNHLPFEAVIKFYNLSIFDKPDRIEEIFQSSKDKFYIEKNGTAIFMFVWKKTDLDFFTTELKNTNSNWSNFVITIKNKDVVGNQDEEDNEEENANIPNRKSSFNADTEVLFRTDLIITNPSKHKKNKMQDVNLFANFDL